jgi:biotin transport system ATP-binding protein
VTQVVAILQKLKADGKTIIVLTHELEKVLALADNLMILYRGKLVFFGLPEEALSSAPLAQWGIRNPLNTYTSLKDLVWNDLQ